MINVGVSAGFHDAAMSVLNGREILYANHCERYSKIKGDPNFNPNLLPLHYNNTAFYEKPFLKNTIQQVKDGIIPIARVNDAVSRILRVKIRAGMFEKGLPSMRASSGKLNFLQKDITSPI